MEYVQKKAPAQYQSILWRKEMIEGKMRRFFGKEATEFVEWVC